MQRWKAAGAFIRPNGILIHHIDPRKSDPWLCSLLPWSPDGRHSLYLRARTRSFLLGHPWCPALWRSGRVFLYTFPLITFTSLSQNSSPLVQQGFTSGSKITVVSSCGECMWHSTWTDVFGYVYPLLLCLNNILLCLLSTYLFYKGSCLVGFRHQGMLPLLCDPAVPCQ